ncbi:MAG: PKD domain-containing protein [Ignavibacteria bacterium]|nr:PKD domain-containing protein [Ignavibacteria bacterium]
MKTFLLLFTLFSLSMPIHSNAQQTTYQALTATQSKKLNATTPLSTISTSAVIPFFYCQSSSVSVPFTVTGTFNSGNIFKAELSDASGSFASPTEIGTLTGTTDGTIQATMPAQALQGSLYRIRVVGNNPSTTGTDNGANLAVNPLPVLYTMTGERSYCEGGEGVIMGLNNTEVGASYQLKRDGTNVGAPQAGNFFPMLFGFHTLAGTYTVTSTYTATGCSRQMTDSIQLVINPLPTKFTVTGGGSYCNNGTGVSVGLSNSQDGVSYQLRIDGVTNGSPINGTGSAISFGNQTSVAGYTVSARNIATGCTQLMTGEVKVTINPLPTKYDVLGGGNFCEGDKGVPVILYTSDTNISYQLKVDGAPIGAPRSGTGVAIEFGLQTQPGNYTVDATHIITGCKSTMTGSKNVIRTPLPPKPTITKVGNILTSSADAGNQWYLNTQQILGATSKTYTPTQSGSYTVIVTLKSCPSPVSIAADVTVEAGTLIAGFTSDKTSGDRPLTVKFTDASAGSPSNWNWNFGDNQSSTEQSPSHTYTQVGSYTVRLIISNGSKSDTVTKNAYITVQDVVVVTADFQGNSTKGRAPLMVKFSDMSTGGPAAWSWDFGDGSALATINNPEHTYTVPGIYSVTLTVTKDSKDFKVTKKDYITVDSESISVDENPDLYNGNSISITPNPTSGSSILKYHSAHSQKVTLSMSSLLGQQIFSREIEVQQGENEIPIDSSIGREYGATLPVGSYYLLLKSSEFTLSTLLQIIR